MTDGRQRDSDLKSEGSAFVLRARIDRTRLAGEGRLHIRLESLDDRAVHHFTDIDAALGHLRQLLLATAAAGGN